MPWSRSRVIGGRLNRCRVLDFLGRTQRGAEQISESANGGAAIVDLAEIGAKCVE
jgi:hypothetical protein